MANRIIFTTPFRVSFPHLAAPYAQEGSKEDPKFSIGAMFPKSGLVPAHVANGVASSNENILAALDEVCNEAFGINYRADSLTYLNGMTAASFADPAWTPELIIAQGHAVASAGGTGNNASMVGVNFPPPLVDGDTDWVKEKNAQGVEMEQVGKPKPQSVGMWKMGFKNKETVGCADPSGQHTVDPKSIYSGCWAVAQLEVTAYQGKKGNVIAIKLLNVQMAYDDENFGGGHVQQAATTAFGDRAITNTNVAAGYGQTATSAVPTPMPVQQGIAPVAVTPVAVAPVAVAPAVVAAEIVGQALGVPLVGGVVEAMNAPVAPVAVAPVAVAPVAVAPVETLTFLNGHTRASFADPAWTDEMIVAQGHATLNDAPAAPAGQQYLAPPAPVAG